METFDIIKLILGITFTGLMVLTGVYSNEQYYKVILAVLFTVGAIYGILQLPYALFILIILGITIYTYIQNGSIEDTLFNSLLVVTVCILLGLFGNLDFFKQFRVLKEGFYVRSSARSLISHSMTSLQCQNACARNKHCKFAYYSRNMDTGGKGACYNTRGSDAAQRVYGGKTQGGKTWRNRKYTPKPPPKPMSKIRHGMFISIRNSRGNWLGALPNGRIKLVNWRRSWETFQVLRHPNRKNWLLRSIHGRYLHFAPSWPQYRVSFIKNGRPTYGWSWESINFQKNGNGRWSIFNPYHRRYMSLHGRGVHWLGRYEQFSLYEVPTRWGIRSTQNRDREIK